MELLKNTNDVYFFKKNLQHYTTFVEMDHSQPLFYLSLSFQQSTVKIYSVRNFANDRIRIMDLCNLNRLSGCHWAYLYRINLKKAFGSVYSFWSQELLPLLQFEPRLAPIISTNFRLVIKLPDNLKVSF